jgi:DNA gyrase subunit A
VGADLVQGDKKLLVMSRKGYGKLTKVTNFPTHKRGGVGIKAAIVNTKTGDLVTVRSLDASAPEVLMISTRGQTIRLGLKDIPLLGRTTQGVRVMRLNGGDTVASLGLLAHSQVEAVTEEAVNTADELDK